MRWGVYGRAEFEFPGVSIFADGVRALGQSATILSQSDHGSGQIGDFDVVVCWGLHGRGEEVRRDYMKVGIPVVVADYGYFRRVNSIHEWKLNYWQLSIDAINRPPLCDVPSDRWESLGLEITPRGGSTTGYPLLCVQTPDDRTHCLTEWELGQWCRDQRRRWPDLVLRPHPQRDHLTYDMPLCEAETLKDALDGARIVITGNSNVGHDALLAGVPVITTFPGAAYAHLAGYRLPDVYDRYEHFKRCAYGQWTWDEMRAGESQRFLLDHQIPAHREKSRGEVVDVN